MVDVYSFLHQQHDHSSYFLVFNTPFTHARQSEFEFSAKMTFKADSASVEAGVALASWVATVWQ